VLSSSCWFVLSSPSVLKHSMPVSLCGSLFTDLCFLVSVLYCVLVVYTSKLVYQSCYLIISACVQVGSLSCLYLVHHRLLYHFLSVISYFFLSVHMHNHSEVFVRKDIQPVCHPVNIYPELRCIRYYGFFFGAKCRILSFSFWLY